MPFIDFIYNQVGFAFSIAGLAAVVPILFLFKQYFRFLDHVQLVFLYWVIISPQSSTFGSHLKSSWVYFIPNFLTFCNSQDSQDIVCAIGGQLSFTVCLLGAIIITFFIVAILKCKKSSVKYEPVYTALKGLFRWTYLCLSYFSINFLIQ
jgi:hypothetical protein